MAKQIIVVTSDECEPCAELKKKLTDNNIKFTEYNIDTKMGVSFLDFIKKKNITFYAVPTVIIMKSGEYTLVTQEGLLEMEGLK